VLFWVPLRELPFTHDLTSSAQPGIRVTLSLMRTVLNMNASEEEAIAWANVVRNDGDAFVAIFDQHRDRTYRHALRLTANVHDAEDVVAAAFLELWRRRNSVRLVDGSVLPWLLVTTTNLSRNVTRGLRRYRALIDALPRAEVAQSAEEAALAQIEELRLAAKVQDALNGLRPSDAALIALTLYEGYSTAQVATALGISDGAARTRLHRARSRMAEALGILEGATGVITKESSR
jgi:RNA polymerase sigma factor (sigma-70 family)